MKSKGSNYASCTAIFFFNDSPSVSFLKRKSSLKIIFLEVSERVLLRGKCFFSLEIAPLIQKFNILLYLRTGLIKGIAHAKFVNFYMYFFQYFKSCTLIIITYLWLIFGKMFSIVYQTKKN